MFHFGGMEIRHLVNRKFKNHRTNENWFVYKAENRCNQCVGNAKRRHILENIKSSSPANVWKFLVTLGIGKQDSFDLQCTIV